MQAKVLSKLSCEELLGKGGINAMQSIYQDI
jgi:hypothetical protein